MPASGRFRSGRTALRNVALSLAAFVFDYACLFPCGKRIGWRCHPFLFRHGSGSPFVRSRVLFWLSCFAGLLWDCLFLWGDPDGGRSLGCSVPFYTERNAMLGGVPFVLTTLKLCCRGEYAGAPRPRPAPKSLRLSGLSSRCGGVGVALSRGVSLYSASAQRRRRRCRRAAPPPRRAGRWQSRGCNSRHSRSRRARA